MALAYLAEIGCLTSKFISTFRMLNKANCRSQKPLERQFAISKSQANNHFSKQLLLIFVNSHVFQQFIVQSLCLIKFLF